MTKPTKAQRDALLTALNDTPPGHPARVPDTQVFVAGQRVTVVAVGGLAGTVSYVEPGRVAVHLDEVVGLAVFAPDDLADRPGQ